MSASLPARDLLDVRLSAAIDVGGCPLCVVRERAERGMLDTTIAERVLDLGFRAGLERDHGFCRRHVAELLVTDRRSSGILGSSILYGAMLERRLGAIREALATRGARRRRGRLIDAARRPGCLVCGEGAKAVDVAAGRLTERMADPDWAAAAAALPFCLDDLVLFLVASAEQPAAGPVIEAQLARLDDLRIRLEGYAYHSAQDRRHLLTDEERAAADEASRVLGGD
ncbi:MAG: DUF6062 family protein [Chloroflexota bacterium]